MSVSFRLTCHHPELGPTLEFSHRVCVPQTARLDCLEDLLDCRKQLYEIDDYQRNYAWRAKLLEEGEEICTMLRQYKQSGPFAPSRVTSELLIGSVILAPNGTTHSNTPKL